MNGSSRQNPYGLSSRNNREADDIINRHTILIQRNLSGIPNVWNHKNQINLEETEGREDFLVPATEAVSPRRLENLKPTPRAPRLESLAFRGSMGEALRERADEALPLGKREDKERNEVPGNQRTADDSNCSATVLEQVPRSPIVWLHRTRR